MNIIDADLTSVEGAIMLDVIAYAPTLGWKNVGLSKVKYVMPPQDGIQDFVLYGTPPIGPALTAIQIFKFSKTMKEKWVRGARIKNSAGRTLLVLRSLVRDGKPIGDDMVGIESAGLKGDKLILDVVYGGGCRTHDFQLSWDGSILKSNPPQVVLSLTHNGNGDPCKALVIERLQFDLSVELQSPEQYVLRVVSNTTEVIAHKPSESSTVPIEDESDDEGESEEWSAIQDFRTTPSTLRVKGMPVMPTPGYTLKLIRAEPQGKNPRILILNLESEPPPGIVIQIPTPTPVSYEEQSEQEYDSVTIEPDGIQIPVEKVQ